MIDNEVLGVVDGQQFAGDGAIAESAIAERVSGIHQRAGFDVEPIDADVFEGGVISPDGASAFHVKDIVAGGPVAGDQRRIGLSSV